MTDPQKIINELFEAILAEGETQTYDPTIHLHPTIAAERWHMDKKSAAERLAKDPRLKKIKVKNPQTGREIDVFIPA